MYGYGLDWDGFPITERVAEDDAKDAQEARENAPSVVLGQMALVLAAALGFALAANLALTMLHIA